MTSEINFALILNLHQPHGNLDQLLDQHPDEGNKILWAIDRIPRSLWRHEDIARVHLSLSGTLLETLSDSVFQEKAYGVVDCGSLLWYLQNASVIDILGTGYYHPVLPLIPKADWDDQLTRWLDRSRHLFARTQFAGFWPPELGFTMELIPQLRRLGYRYVIVDSEHVEPVTEMSWQELRYRPHVARYGEDEIIVIVRDRDLSNAQESGMDAGWFIHEVCQRTRECGFSPLVTTATDGDNGGWFRNTDDGANFWTAFHGDLMERVARGASAGIRPSFIGEYLDRYGVMGEVTVRAGAWNTGWHHGRDFSQWTESRAQREALAALCQVSSEIHALGEAERTSPWGENAALRQAKSSLLRAETSCNFYWGDAWLDRCHSDLDQARREVARARKVIRAGSPKPERATTIRRAEVAGRSSRRAVS